MFHVGDLSGFEGKPAYPTLAQAAEAIRVAQGWAEVHLADPVHETEWSFPVYYAYPTPEALAADKGWSGGHCICEM